MTRIHGPMKIDTSFRRAGPAAAAAKVTRGQAVGRWIRSLLLASVGVFACTQNLVPHAHAALDAPRAVNAAVKTGKLPGVERATPADGALGVMPGGRIAVRFATPMRAETLNQDSVTLMGPAGATDVRIDPSPDGRSVRIVPVEELFPGSHYTLFISGAEDRAGRSLPLAMIGFRTANLSPHQGNVGASLETSEDDDEAYAPGPDAPGVWRSNRPLPAFVEARLHQTPPSVAGTGVAGLVLRLSDKPLADATVTIGQVSVRTDAQGRFALTGIEPGKHQMFVDGSTANSRGHEYPQLSLSVDVKPDKVVEIAHPVYLPRIRAVDWVNVSSPAQADMVVKHPNIPGMEIRIPKGTVLRDRQGKILTRFAVLPVPIERSAVPLPVSLPIAVMFHPGGTRIQTVSGSQGSGGIDLVYPNYAHQAPGTVHQMWAQAPRDNGWMVYALGRVTDDGLHIVADAGSALHEFVECGAPVLPATPPPSPRVPPNSCGAGSLSSGAPPSGPSSAGPLLAGDPVDCSSGVFLHRRTELSIADVLPINFTRTYRPGDTIVRPFGKGTTHNYAMYLRTPVAGYSAVQLVLPDGALIDFNAVSSNPTGMYTVYRHTSTPSPYYGATVVGYTSDASFGEIWTMTLKDGTRYVFYNRRDPNLIAIIDRYGNQLTLGYSASAQLATITSSNGRYVSLSYDTSGRVSQMQDHTGRTWTYSYTAAGYLKSATYPDGNTESYDYDSQNRMRMVTDPRGNTMVTNTYDTNNRVSQQTYADGTTNTFDYTVNAAGQVTQTNVTDENGNVRHAQFNAAGYPLSITDALGKPEAQTRSFARNASTNQVLSETDALGRVTSYQYDPLGNVTRVTKLDGTPSSTVWSYTYQGAFSRMLTATDPIGHTSTFSYDVQGNLTQSSDPLGNIVTRAYTSAGQLASITTYPNGAATTTFGYSGGDLVSVVDPLGRQTTINTDALGRVASVEDPMGNLTTMDYDSHDRLVQRTDPLGNAVQYGYDANGNLLTFTDALGNVTSWQYDLRNRKSTKTDALSQTESYQYDAAGNLAHITDRKSQVSGFTYDALNRLTGSGYGATASAPTSYTSTTAYTWDAGNRLRQVVDSIGSTLTRSYDERFDALAQEDTPEGSVTYTYYGNGQRHTVTPSGGTALNYTYDDASRLTGITQAAGSGGGPIPASAQSVGIGYDAANRRVSLTLPNGIKLAYGYDDADELQSIVYKKADGTTIGDLSYTYDPAGRRIGMGGSLARSALPAAIGSAQYDINNRLTSRDGTNYTYDANGNLTGDGASTYTWNARNQLASVTGVSSASFNYDGLGRRRGGVIMGSGSSVLYDGWNSLQLKTGATVVENRLIGSGLDEIYGRTRAGTSESYATDALGSTIALTDGTQANTVQYTYDPYGGTSESPSSTNLTKYTGRDQVAADLYYYRNRFYMPSVGRFVSEDPIGLAGGTNVYSYVNGNSLSLVDPLGLMGQGSGANGGTPTWGKGGPTSGCGCPIRGPDFLQFQLDIYVATFSGTFSRSGNSFFGGGVVRNYPNPVGVGASTSLGWLNRCRVTPQDVDNFIGGFGMGVAGGYLGLGGGFSWSPGSGTATQIGAGFGFSANPGGLSADQGATGLGGW